MTKKELRKKREEVRMYAHTAMAMVEIGRADVAQDYKNYAHAINREIIATHKHSKKAVKAEATYDYWYWNKYMPSKYPDAVELF